MDTLEEQLASSQRDVGLIIDDVNRRELESAVRGMNTVIRDLTKLRDATKQALASHEKVKRKTRRISWVPFETQPFLR